jgi:uncharacterized LabA/DUF88 family protein
VDEKKERVVVLIDYENISLSAADKGKIVDFEKLHNFLLEFGEIISAFVFVPDHCVYSLPDNLNELGFEIILCQKRKIGSEKLEDRVDISLIKMGMKFCYFKEITHVVVVTNDGHMSEPISFAKNMKKKVSLFGTSKIAYILTKIVTLENIHEIPLKDI